MSVTTEQLIIELNKRNLKLEHIMEYIKFEDECIEKGFTLNSLIKAREKQIPKKPVFIDDKAWHCPNCGVAVADVYNMDTGDRYCFRCGQKLDWGE